MKKLRLALASLVLVLTVGFGYVAATPAHAEWYDGGAYGKGGNGFLQPWAELIVCGWSGC